MEQPRPIIPSKADYRVFSEYTGITKSKLSQLKDNIKRGKSETMREAVLGFGKMREYWNTLRKDNNARHERDIKELKKAHFSDMQQLRKERNASDREELQFYRSFISRLDDKTKWDFNDEYHERFGTTAGI